MIPTERLTDVLVHVADTLVADFDLLVLLHNLTDDAAAVSAAEAVGLMLADHEQAKGALAQQQGITPDAAFDVLRSTARSSRRRLVDVAHQCCALGRA